METTSAVTIVFNSISVDSVKEHTFKADRFQAQLRQVVDKNYPGGKISSDKQDSLYDLSSFGFKGQSFQENRVCWIDVPKGATQEQVQTLIDNHPQARIYKVLSSDPILTDSQEQAIAQGLTTLEVIADRQMIRNSDGKLIDRGGQVIPEPVSSFDKGRIQYKALYFSKTAKADEDYRKPIASLPHVVMTVEQPAQSTIPFELETEAPSNGKARGKEKVSK